MLSDTVPGTGVRVAACLASTLDGHLAHPKIAVLGSDHDRRRLESLRAQADVLLYGAGTARADSRREIQFRYPEIGRPVPSRLGRAVPPIVVLCRRPDFDFTGPFWQTRTPKLLLHAGISPSGGTCPSGLPDDVTYQAMPAAINPVHPHTSLGVSMATVLAHLLRWLAEVAIDPDEAAPAPAGDRPVRVLCEGGGGIVAALIGEQLLDELFLTITSWVAGDEEDTPLSVGGITGPQRFRLESARVLASTSEVFLRYRGEGRDPWPITEQS